MCKKMFSLNQVSTIGVILITFCFLQQTNGRQVDVPHRRMNYTFPRNFRFGVSTSAYQIEGAWNEGGKGENQWDTYLHEHPNFTIDGSNGDIAADSYHKYKDDIAIINELGVSHYRLSLSWSRLLPNGTIDNVNIEGVNYYRKLLIELLKARITPVVTLYHWDLPTIFMKMGGWTNPEVIDYFEDYVRLAYELFGDLVKLWITINEPHMHCLTGYGKGPWPAVPNIKSPGILLYQCFHHMLLAHSRAYKVYDNEFRRIQNGNIGLSLDATFIVPKTNTLADLEAAERYLQMNVGLFAHPIFSKYGNYPDIVRRRVDGISSLQGFRRSRLPYFTALEVEELRYSADFLGINHYTTMIASASTMEEGWSIPSLDHDTGVKVEMNSSKPVPSAAWVSFYPAGFRGLMNWLTNTYGNVPIVITENGYADKADVEDRERVLYYNEYLYALLQAIHEDGCNVQGYFAWTLLDNFEWYNAYTVKYGLYRVDYGSPNRTRTPKLSAKSFREIVRTRKVNNSLVSGV